MPSSPSPILDLELQANGENLNAWGQILNAVARHLEQAIASFPRIAVEADVTLTNTSYVDNQSRRAGYVFEGSGGYNIICPSGKSRKYLVRNTCAGAVTFTHSSGGTDAIVAAGAIKWVATDGTDFFTPEEVDYLPLAGGTLTGELILNADATDGMGAVTLQQLNATALGSVSVSYAFSDITGKPTTIAGYGITDAYTQTEANNLFEGLIIRQVVSGDVNPASVNRWYLVDTGTAARSITLPASPSNGNEIIISDRDGNAGTNNITVARNGKTIAGLAEDLTIDINYARVRLRYDGTSDWELI